MSLPLYGDFFKWNRELLEDDWNDGKAYVAKLKTKGNDIEYTSTIKLGEAKNGAHAVDLAQKFKCDIDVFGGVYSAETTVKNDGSVSWEKSWDILKELNPSLAGAKLLLKGSNGSKDHKPMQVGTSYENEVQGVRFEQYFTCTESPQHFLEWAYQRKNWLVGGLIDRKLLAGRGWKADLGARWEAPEGGVRSGFTSTWADKEDSRGLQMFSCFFTTLTAGGKAGAQFHYNHLTNESTALVGTQLEKGDHVWKFRLNSNGMARAALQWKIHPTTKATLNTKVQMSRLVGGSIDSLPLGLQLAVQY